MNDTIDLTKCLHKKEPYHLWCYDCGSKRAGPKPSTTIEIGGWAIGKSMDYPGTITKVEVVLMGVAVESQSWLEYVAIINSNEDWYGPRSEVVQLKAMHT